MVTKSVKLKKNWVTVKNDKLLVLVSLIVVKLGPYSQHFIFFVTYESAQ